MQQNQMSFPSRYAPPQPLNERPCDDPVVPDTSNAAVSPHGFTEGPSSFSSAMPTSRLLPSLPSGLSIDLQASYSSSTLGSVEGMLRPAVPSSDGAQQLSGVDANPHANAEWLEVLQLQEDEMLAHDARELSTGSGIVPPPDLTLSAKNIIGSIRCRHHMPIMHSPLTVVSSNITLSLHAGGTLSPFPLSTAQTRIVQS